MKWFGGKHCNQWNGEKYSWNGLSLSDYSVRLQGSHRSKLDRLTVGLLKHRELPSDPTRKHFPRTVVVVN